MVLLVETPSTRGFTALSAQLAIVGTRLEKAQWRTRPVLLFEPTLVRHECDVWKPGEHNGTFRGYNPAFVTGTRAHGVFWSDGALGTQSGLCVHLLAAALGLSLITTRSTVVYDAIKLLRTACLVHLGIRAMPAARRAGFTQGSSPTCSPEGGAVCSSASCRSSSTAAGPRHGRSSSSASWTS